MHIPTVFWFIIKYVAPVYLLVTIGRFAWKTLPQWIEGLGSNPVARNTVFLLLGVIVLLCVLVYVGEKRWRRRGSTWTGSGHDHRWNLDDGGLAGRRVGAVDLVLPRDHEGLKPMCSVSLTGR